MTGSVDEGAPPTPAHTLRALWPSVYGPALLFAVGQGAVVPVIAVAATEMGASPAFGGLCVALLGIGTLLFDLPAGKLVARFGERLTLVLGTGLVIVASLGCMLTRSLAVYAACMLVLGAGWGAWLLVRLNYVTGVVPVHLRGRAMASLGGVIRMGSFIGPFLGAALIAALVTRSVFGLHAVLTVAACALLLWAAQLDEDPAEVKGREPVRLRVLVRTNRQVLLTAGSAVVCMSVLRAVRQALLPLWAAGIGLDASAVGIVYGLGVAMETALFYPAGWIMDRVGRRVVSLLVLGFMGAGFLLMPFANSFAAVVAVALVLGVGNGLGSGIVMTLGADFAPTGSRAEFLSVWRLTSDAGGAAGPLVAAAVTAAVTMGAASVVTGAIGLLGALIVWRFVPETLVPQAQE